MIVLSVKIGDFMFTPCFTGASVDDLLDSFGVKFVNVSFANHQKMLTSLGCSLHSLLNNLDHMHQVFKEAKKFDDMKAPSFTCEPQGADGHVLVVHYYSVRRGLEKFVSAALRQCAKLIYDVTVVIDVFKEFDPETGCVSFKIESPDVSLVGETNRQNGETLRKKSTNVQDLPISMETFCKAFPFHIIFDRNFEIVQMGSALVRILGGALLNGNRRLSDYFTLVRPEIKWNFRSSQAQCNSSFLLHLNSSISEKIKQVINLTGQMIDMPESECILYVGSPVVENLEHLRKQGLYISDIPIHDATRDLILVSEQSKAQGGLKKRLQSLKAKVQETSAELEHEKKKTEDLLEAIFPKEVAKQLIHKEHVEAQTIESVTMLFSDLVGFTAICGKCAPMDVVNMLSKLYTKFDTKCTELELYKVSSICHPFMHFVYCILPLAANRLCRHLIPPYLPPLTVFSQVFFS
jgi:guanylate cyclase soluble subunit alpha